MSRLRSLVAAAAPRDAALAAALAAVLLFDGQFNHEGLGISPAGVAAVALATVPLAWRTAVPPLVLAVVVAGVFACLFTLKPVDTVVLPPMLAAYTVALTGHRMRAVITGLGGMGCALLGVAAASGELRHAVYNAAMMAVAVAAGDAVRSRRAVAAAGERRAAEREAAHEREAERRVAEERLAIARDVHDVVAHAMVAINVQAGVAAHLLDERPEQARSALTEIKRVSGSALGDLRATLGMLREESDGAAPVRPAGALAGLGELAAPLRAAGVDVDVEVDVDADALPSAVGATAYRIVQEALTNVQRHAAAGQVSVRIVLRDERLRIDVHDDGAVPAAIPAGEGDGEGVPAGGGNGVRGMRERAAAAGGSAHAGPDPGGGWRVQAVLPVR